ncbi:MAG: hypothetical protein KDC12_12060 [Flavobacteriales bacterium]|nr:hypothetical protein [Flavobacteriales bacterium]
MISLTTFFERKGKTMPYTSANGYMFTLFNKDAEIGVRLSPEAQERFIARYDSGPYFSYGAKMKDYVIIPEELWSNNNLMKSLIEESYHFVMTLPPK